jgi:succinate dehydrogenase/fumarate reductase cytochrome b subunit
MTTNNPSQKSIHSTIMDIDSLIDRMKTEDARNLRLSKSFQWIYWIMIPIYTGLMIVNPDKELTSLHRISGVFYVLSFIVFAIIFRKNTKEYKQVNYSLPTLEMMKKAARRYQVWHPRLFLVLLALLLMNIGLTISFFPRLGGESGIMNIVWFQLTYFSVMSVSFLIGLQIWRTRQKPIRDQALAIVNELEQ